MKQALSALNIRYYIDRIIVHGDQQFLIMLETDPGIKHKNPPRSVDVLEKNI